MLSLSFSHLTSAYSPRWIVATLRRVWELIRVAPLRVRRSSVFGLALEPFSAQALTYPAGKRTKIYIERNKSCGAFLRAHASHTVERKHSSCGKFTVQALLRSTVGTSINLTMTQRQKRSLNTKPTIQTKHERQRSSNGTDRKLSIGSGTPSFVRRRKNRHLSVR